jgi:RNA ligase
MSAKYPRSLHLPWSPGGTNDDKRMADVTPLLDVPLVITEKCDGSNLTYTRLAVFSRSHSGPPGHPSFNLAKATHARIADQLSLGLSLFCEYCYAVHSIEYDALPDYSLVFGARDDREGRWWEWDMVVAQAADLGLPTVPELYRGSVSSARELEALTLSLAAQPSAFGGPREGVVVRRAGEFGDADFQRSLAKWVRRDHVTTDEHWMHQSIRPQRLAKTTPSI